jgi:hypothetical protein
MRKNLVLAFMLCFAATTGFSQSGRLSGKWVTERHADPFTVTDAQRKQSVQLVLTVDGVKASGTLDLGGLGGAFYSFEDGKVTGDRVQFRPGGSTERILTVEMVDDNTVMVYGRLSMVGTNVQDLMSVLPGLVRSPFLVASSPTAAVQGARASISGIAQDPTKAVIPGVTVTATNVDTGEMSAATTNASGRYAFPGMRPGNYTMTASLSGFKSSIVGNISIGGTQFLQNFTLELAVPAKPTADTCVGSISVWLGCVLLHRAN